MGITSKEFKEAGERMDALRASTPFATAAHYDRKSKSVIIKLSNGLGIFFSPEDAQGLLGQGHSWPLPAELVVPAEKKAKNSRRKKT